MALLHQAELRPSKLELAGSWAPTQPWFAGDRGAELTSVGAYRFDDPAGEVGVETLLVRAGDGPVMQIPLTYRGAPLVGADDRLIGTMEHSVLGPRWVYDGVGDPVYLLTVASTVISGGTQAELYLEVEGERVHRQSTALVSGSGLEGFSLPALPMIDELAVTDEGGLSVAQTGRLRIAVRRVLDERVPEGMAHDNVGLLTGTWVDQPEPRVLVFITERQAAAQ